VTAPIIHEAVEQGTPEWLALRLGRPTASEFKRFMKDDFTLRTGEMPETYLYEKVAERIRKTLLPSAKTHEMEQGNILEEEALPWYELSHDTWLRRVGFVEAAGGAYGCSPDALIGEDSGLECKCPMDTAHLKYLDRGELPSEYKCQVHGSMFVTGRKRWVFVSYHRSYRKFVLTVERDEAAMAVMAETMNKFCEKLNATYERLKGRKKP
jgi:hypothetical protein